LSPEQAQSCLLIYSVAIREGKKEGKKHIRYYDPRVREEKLKSGDLVIVQNADLRRKFKLAYRV
jgi:hypothetical protein